MKRHIIIKLRSAIDGKHSIPFWGDAIESKEGVPVAFSSAIDNFLHRYDMPIWATHEFKPSGADWSDAEKRNGLNRVYRLILQKKRSIPPDLINAIRLEPFVEYARAGSLINIPIALPAKAMAPLSNDDDVRASIDLPRVHRITRGDPEIIVAVLDTGVCTTHPELRNSLLPGCDFVDIISGTEQFIGDSTGYDSDPTDRWNGHGTHVAGIIGARGIAMSPGVAPQCRILPVRVLAALKSDEKTVGAGLEDNVSTGIKWAVDKHADVINLSLGVRHEGGGLPYKEIVDYARDNGVTIVAAAGNSPGENLYYPGALPHVITVGSHGPEGAISSFSTYGKQVSVIAPGEQIYSSFLNDSYAFSSGTSQAAAFVTGAVALLKSRANAMGMQLNDTHVKYLLHRTSDKMDRRFRHPLFGYGRLNIMDALKLLNYSLQERKQAA